MDDQNDKYSGFTLSDKDIIIGGYRLICTCSACPEQYDVFDDSSGAKVGYLRLRHGHFRAHVPDCGGEVVYDADTSGDGIFDPDERMPQLTAAVAAIAAAHARGGK